VAQSLDQFGLSCARVEKVSFDERLNAAWREQVALAWARGKDLLIAEKRNVARQHPDHTA